MLGVIFSVAKTPASPNPESVGILPSVVVADLAIKLNVEYIECRLTLRLSVPDIIKMFVNVLS